MGRMILSRLFQAILVLILVTVVIFTIIRLSPGDPAVMELGLQAEDPRFREALSVTRQKMGLDKPIIVQYGIWLKKIASGDFGVSTRSRQPVITMIVQKLPASLELIISGLMLGLLLSLVLSIVAALRHNTWVDSVIRVISVIGIATPPFWLGLLLIMIFGAILKWFPCSGYIPIWVDPIRGLKHLILPAIGLGTYEVASFTRFLRAQLLEELPKDYIRTAEAKGLSTLKVIFRHALKNALIPFITVLGLELGVMIGNTVIIEQVYGWSGIGWLLLQAINNRDYPTIQGIIVLLTMMIVFSNLVADIMYNFVDPRIRETIGRRPILSLFKKGENT